MEVIAMRIIDTMLSEEWMIRYRVVNDHSYLYFSFTNRDIGGFFMSVYFVYIWMY